MQVPWGRGNLAKRNRVEAEIRIANMALSDFRKAFELEQQISK